MRSQGRQVFFANTERKPKAPFRSKRQNFRQFREMLAIKNAVSMETCLNVNKIKYLQPIWKHLIQVVTCLTISFSRTYQLI